MAFHSGPNPTEQKIIRRMCAAGATLEQLQAKFPHIDAAAIGAWHRSLAPKQPATPADPAAVEAAGEFEENPVLGADGPMPGTPEAAEHAKSRKRRG
jgi:hypothetical protein